MRVSTVMVLIPLLFEVTPAAAAAEEAPLPGAFLEFLADMVVEEEGELLDPLVLLPESRQGAAEPADEPLEDLPGAPQPVPADGPMLERDAPEAATGAEPAGDAQPRNGGGFSRD